REMYYQVRLIGVADQGRELVRVARLKRGVEVIGQERLQQKGKRSYFINSIKLEPGEFLFSDITLNREHGKITQPPQPMLRVSTALFDGAGKRYGILLINVDFNVLTASLQSQQSQQSQQSLQSFFIVNNRGDYLVHPDAERAMAFEYQRQLTFQHDFSLTERTPQQAYEYAGTRIEEHLLEQQEKALLIGQVYFDHHHMDRYLSVGATVELQQLREQSIGLRDRMLWLTLGLALFLGLITYLLARFLTRPVQEMIAAAVQVGRGDENVEIPVKGKDEIGQLGGALSQMLQHLAASKQEMQSLNAGLEKKVSERTGQLARLAGELEAQNRDLEQAVLSAEQAAMAKSQFLATMSHEIRTPLNGVLGLTELVLATELAPQQRDNLKTVQSSGETLLTILNDILDFSKIEAGLMEIKPVEFNPNEVIEHVAKLYSAKVNEDEGRLELIARGLAQLPNMLVGDSDRLHQVMMNLLSNAVKFTEYGEIVVSVDALSESDDELRLRFQVSDTGPGISEANQQELFDEFTQADGTDTRKHGGTGLGLSIVKRLLELMGGDIQLESKLGKGSRFFFDLSLQKGAAISDGPHHYGDDFAKWRTLVVDDNASNREMLVGMLGAWGMPCESCNCGSSAMQALHQMAGTDDPYGMVLIDQQMDGMDGMALARVIKDTPELHGLKVIMTTSLDMSFDQHTRQQYGLDGFIRKPIYVHSLFETILAVIGVRERQLVDKQALKNIQRRERILLAEDNMVNQQVATGMLGNQGFTDVDVAHNGLEALELFGENSYDLIFMDVQMPELDGISTTREIRQLEQYRE
ncbi:MAG: response regulator, partial [Mariprofundus sp.]